MNYTALALVVAASLLAGCQHHAPDPAPQLTGSWTLDHYDFNQPDAYGYGRVTGTQPGNAANYLVISGQAIEYHDPALSAPVSQAYTRQGSRLHIAAGTPNDRVETITRLTAQELGLHIARPSQVGLRQDSIVLDYSYKRR